MMLHEIRLHDVSAYSNACVQFPLACTTLYDPIGVGKTLLLDAIWFALTGVNFNRGLLPRAHPAGLTDFAVMTACIAHADLTERVRWRAQSAYGEWRRDEALSASSARPVLYMGHNGAVGVYLPRKDEAHDQEARTFILTSDQVMHGMHYRERKGVCIAGFINDYARWFHAKDRSAYVLFGHALNELVTRRHTFGEPTRIARNNRTDVPTAQWGEHPHVAVTHLAWRTQRAIACAYLLGWLREEHARDVRAGVAEPSASVLVLVDDVDAFGNVDHVPYAQHVRRAACWFGFNPQVIATTQSPVLKAANCAALHLFAAEGQLSISNKGG